MKKYFFMLSLFVVLFSMAQAQSPGFFLDDWDPKSISITDYINVTKPASSATAIVNIDAGNEITQVSKYLFSNNANLYMSQMVDQPDLLENIRNLNPNVIRFPGGNISNVFFWDMEVEKYYDDLPAELIDGSDGSVDQAYYWSGKNTGGWTCTLDNYYNMLDSTGQTGMITVNYSYARYGLSNDPVAAAAQYAADWVRYDNGRTKYWEIGNENSGPWQAGYRINTETNQDGQPDTINGGVYGEHFLVFANAMRAAAAEIGHEIFIGAQLIQEESENSWNPTEHDWNKLYFEAAGNAADFYIVHTYYTPYNQNSSVETILNSTKSVTVGIMDWMKTTTALAGIDLKPIAMTEWNIFAVGSLQAVSHINGMHASMVLGELIENKYGQAARWDLANGWDNGNDHGLFNQGDEPGNVPRWNPRPAFYHLYYAQKYYGDRSLASQSTGASDIQSYASRFSSGQAAVMIANKGRTDQVVQLTFDNFAPGSRYYWYTLTGGDDNGDFSRKVFINGEGTEYDAGGPANYQAIPARSATTDGGVKITAPALSITHVIIDEGSGGGNTPPVAVISASQTSGEIAFTVNFSAEGSFDADGDSLEYSWDFGDGTNDNGSNVTHTYIRADDYKVKVTVSDGMSTGQASVDISALSTGATCNNPTVKTLPVLHEGGGEQCLVVEGTITNVNSWDMWEVSINGVDFTNKYSEEMPDKINGKYYIHFSAGESWSHVEVNGESNTGTTYTLTTNVQGQGFVSPADGTFDENSTISLTATPETGWEFANWSGDLSGSTNPATLTMDSDKSVTAVFNEVILPVYSVNVAVSGSGTVTLDPTGGEYTEGESVSITAVPADGYIFNGWTGDISSSDNPLTVTITGDLNLIANFIEESTPTYNLTAITDGNGIISLNPPGGTYLLGDTVEVEAVPDSGYVFDAWSGDLSGSTNPTTITMDSDKNIYASFTESGTPCASPLPVNLSFNQDGAGTYCFSTTDDVAYVNSWNMAKVTINNVDYTNTWSNSMPPKIDGAYYIYYEGYYPWSHFEAGVLKVAGESLIAEAKMYPNPFTETFTLRLDYPKSVVDVAIYDKTGRMVQYFGKSGISGEMQLGEELDAGFYLIKVTSLYGFETYSITKN